MYDNNEYAPQRFNLLPPVCKHLLIINVLMFLLSTVLSARGVDLNRILGLHLVFASDFHFWQPITYAFMHEGFSHLFFNMFALWMFGYTLENVWGSKRFLIFCLVTALGAALAQEITYYFMNYDLISKGYKFIKFPDGNILPTANYLNRFNTIGASGIVFGVLLAFGMMFPNTYIYLYFLVPMKTKWFVLGYCLLELFNGVVGTSDGVAHFAHLGGALAGLLLILWWKRKRVW